MLVWVSRNGDLSVSAVVSLANSGTNNLVVPASVTIPAGLSTAPFTATVLDDGVPDSNTVATIYADSGGYQSATAEITVVNTDVPSLALSLASPQITEGQTVNATVTSTTTSTNPLTVFVAERRHERSSRCRLR